MGLTLTRVVTFTATHHYAVRGWTDERNTETFGNSARPHSHTYQCAVTVSGKSDAVTGMIVDLGLLDRVLKEEVVERFDGRGLNADSAFSGGRQLPTTEALCREIWDRVEPRLRDACVLEAVRVQENPLLYAELRRD